jgi:hypothetical protein
MNMFRALVTIFAVSILSAAPSVDPATPLQWQTVSLTFDGPQTSETATPNPFIDYRMSVTFSKDGESLTAQGFFATDGDAANSSAVDGNKWRVRFTPPEPGRWTWRASFRTGTDVAYSADPGAGSAGAFDGETGSFEVSAAPANARGFQKKGYLRYVNGHYLQFQNGEYFVKGGAGSPENFLGYFEFDGTFDTAAHRGIATDAGTFLHHYAPHARDWRTGDPTWQGSKGKNIIGALNYLASEGMNSLYFLTYNLDGGDGKDTWMWTDPEVRDRFDVSKLDQWEIVFSHMEQSGILMHLFIQETENDEELGGSPKLNRTRQLYLRELVARFGHHLAIIWDLGEENDTPRLDRLEISRYITSLEPIAHPVTVHTHNTRSRRSYTSMIGAPEFQATAIQGRMEDANAEAVSLRARSAWSGQPWVIFHDEQAPASVGVMPDENDPTHDKPRKQELWGNLMGGGAGVEWYFGYNYAHMDLNVEDLRSRDIMWDQTRYALEFFRQHLPFHEMWPANDLSTTPGVYVFAKEGEIYAVYSPESEATRITLSSGEYSLHWYNPRTGGALVVGASPTLTVTDGLMRDEGAVTLTPPSDRGKDWVALLKRVAE